MAYPWPDQSAARRALDVPAETVTDAVAETKRQRAAAEDAAWRAAFKPHAIILTEHTRPTSITMAAFTGADRHLWVDFEPGTSPVAYVQQALKAARRRSPIQFYGAATSVVVNYGPDAAVRFDLDGNAVEVLSRAYEPGQLTISIRGRPVPAGALAAIFSGGDKRGIE